MPSGTPPYTQISTIDEARELLTTKLPEALEFDDVLERAKVFLFWGTNGLNLSNASRLSLNDAFFSSLLPTWLDLGAVSVSPAYRGGNTRYKVGRIRVEPRTEGVRLTGGAQDFNSLLEKACKNHHTYILAQGHRLTSLQALRHSTNPLGREGTYSESELASRLERMDGVLWYNLDGWFKDGGNGQIIITFSPTIHIDEEYIGVTTPVTYRLTRMSVVEGYGSHPHNYGTEICFGNVAGLVKDCFRTNDLHTLLTLIDRHALSFSQGPLSNAWILQAFIDLAKLTSGSYKTGLGWNRWDKRTARDTKTGKKVDIEAVLQEVLNTKADFKTILKVVQLGDEVVDRMGRWGFFRDSLGGLIEDVIGYKNKKCGLCGKASTFLRGGCSGCNQRIEARCRCPHEFRRTTLHRYDTWMYRPWHPVLDNAYFNTRCFECDKAAKHPVVIRVIGNWHILCSLSCHNKWIGLVETSTSDRSKTFQEVYDIGQKIEKGELAWKDYTKEEETAARAAPEASIREYEEEEQVEQEVPAPMNFTEVTGTAHSAPLTMQTVTAPLASISEFEEEDV